VPNQRPAPPGAGRLTAADHADLDALLAASDADRAARYPGDAGDRQPVHTVYLPADRFGPDLPARWGAAALDLLAEHCPGPGALAALLDLPQEQAETIAERVLAKLRTEPVEDLRIDFEDGYGHRPDEVEDADAWRAGQALAAASAAGTAPPWAGIRFKCLEPATRPRGLRTLDLFLAGLLEAGPPPAGLRLTLPKVTTVEQVSAMALVCERLEQAHGPAAGRLGFEVQVETPQAVLGSDGTATVARLIAAAPDRVNGLHFGTYDYSAALGIAAAQQSMDHPAADHAKAVLQLAAAGTGVRVSDGSTNVLPVGDAASVRAAWRLHARLVTRSLERGFYQGWDLHPGQLVTRYAATYAFFRSGLDAAATRLRDYLDRRDGGVLDEPATAFALTGYLNRAVACGAVDPSEVESTLGRPLPPPSPPQPPMP
jgi:citrate lyase beta subunit